MGGRRSNKKKLLKVSEENLKIIKKHLAYRESQSALPRKSLVNIQGALRKVSDFSYFHCNNKPITELTKEDLMEFFKPSAGHVSQASRDIHAPHIIAFYRFVDGIEEPNVRPKRMAWFRKQTAKQKRRQTDPDLKEKHWITPKEYQLILQYSNDAYGQNKALWETLEISGARPSEVARLKVRDVIIDENSNVTIKIEKGESKTIPRPIPMMEQPHKLIRWIGNHPFKDDKDASLWVSEKTGIPITVNEVNPEEFIDRRFRAVKKRCKKNKTPIKDTITPKSFRKNRGTKLFILSDSKESTINDSNIAKHMGWTPQTVMLRRQEYELTDYEDLKKKMFSEDTLAIDYDSIMRENKQLKEQMKLIETKGLVEKKDYNKKIKELEFKLEFLEMQYGIVNLDGFTFFYEKPDYIYTRVKVPVKYRNMEEEKLGEIIENLWFNNRKEIIKNDELELKRKGIKIK